MKKFIGFLTCAICYSLFTSFVFAQSVVPAYQFSLNSLDGKKVELASLKGKVIFLDFWASWCPPCRASIPAVSKLYENYKNNKDVVIIGVNMEDAQTARKFVAQNKIQYLNVIGDEITYRRYQVRGIPTFILIDKKGNIAGRWVGFNESLLEEWFAKINTALAMTVEEPKPIKIPSKKIRKK